MFSRFPYPVRYLSYLVFSQASILGLVFVLGTRFLLMRLPCLHANVVYTQRYQPLPPASISKPRLLSSLLRCASVINPEGIQRSLRIRNIMDIDSTLSPDSSEPCYFDTSPCVVSTATRLRTQGSKGKRRGVMLHLKAVTADVFVLFCTTIRVSALGK